MRPGHKISRLSSSIDNMVFLAGVADAESVEVTKAQEADNPKQVTTPEAGLEKNTAELKRLEEERRDDERTSCQTSSSVCMAD